MDLTDHKSTIETDKNKGNDFISQYKPNGVQIFLKLLIHIFFHPLYLIHKNSKKEKDIFYRIHKE